jgi:collagen type VII alpha
MSYFRKVSAGLVKEDITEFVGEVGNIFFNIDTGELRISDGVTPGGLEIYLNGSQRGFTGSVGPAGEQGYRGYIGFTGSKGDKGDPGPPGSGGGGGTGDGYTGSVGYTGSKGDKGDPGQDGASTDKGYTGSVGYVGSVGYTGSVGSGYVGSVGYTGSKGDKGDNGSVGYAGSVGYTGSKGDKGDPGSQGVSINFLGAVNTVGDLSGSGNTQGDAHIVRADGNLYVWNGSVWTDVGDIVGFTGSKGDTGYVGSSGAAVDKGYTGSKGDTGSVGYSGSAGYTGSASTIQGPTGYVGSVGYSGSAGYTGSASTIQGPIGYAGSVGYTGSASAGYVGSQGIVGYVGSRGFSTSISILDENAQITSAASSINFVGAGVTATASSNAVTVTIPGGGGGTTGLFPHVYDKVTADFTTATMSNVTLTQIGGAIKEVGGNGTNTLTLTMNTGYMPFMMYVTGYSTANSITTTKMTLGPQLASVAQLTGLSNNPNVYTWTTATANNCNTSAAAGNSTMLIILSRSTSI